MKDLSGTTYPKKPGFSLLELLIVLTISAILISLAVPSFSHLIATHKSSQAINRLVGSIHFARMQSITRGRVVTLCPRGPDTASCGKDWSAGTLVFEDLNADGESTPPERLLWASPAFEKGSRLVWSSFGSDRHLRFTPKGFTLGQNGSFTYCPANGDARYAKRVVVNRTGRVRLAEDKNNNGIVENSKGEDIEC